MWVEQVLMLVYRIRTYKEKKWSLRKGNSINNFYKVTNLLGEGVLLFDIFLEHFSIGVDTGLGSILDSKLFGFSTD